MITMKRPERFLILGSGARLPCRFAGLATIAPQAFIEVQTSFVEAYNLFSNQSETMKMLDISVDADGNETITNVIKGYIILMGIEIPDDSSGFVRVSLRRKYVDE